MILLKLLTKPRPSFLEMLAEALHTPARVSIVLSPSIHFYQEDQVYHSSGYHLRISNDADDFWQLGVSSGYAFLPAIYELESLVLDWYKLPFKPPEKSKPYMLHPDQVSTGPVGISLKQFQLECIKIYGEERIRRLDRYFNHKNSYPYHAADQLVDIGDYLFSIRYVILESSDQRQLVFSDHLSAVCLQIDSGFDPCALVNNFYDYGELDTGVNNLGYDDPADFISKIPKIKLHYRIDAGGVHDFTYPEYRDIDKTP